MKKFNNITIESAVAYHENVLSVCNNKIEHLTHPELYGCCLSRCNSIVMNKERLMTVTTDENNMTSFEFAPLYPTYFSLEVADSIVKNDIYKDCNGNRIKMEVVHELEYYQLLKEITEKYIEALSNLSK